MGICHFNTKLDEMMYSWIETIYYSLIVIADKLYTELNLITKLNLLELCHTISSLQLCESSHKAELVRGRSLHTWNVF